MKYKVCMFDGSFACYRTTNTKKEALSLMRTFISMERVEHSAKRGFVKSVGKDWIKLEHAVYQSIFTYYEVARP
jgi:hypothetical protein